MEKYCENFSKIISAYRRKEGYTQEKFAEQIGVSKQTVRTWEQAKNLPDLTALIKLRNYIGITIDEMLGLKTFFEKCVDANLEKI